MKTLSINVKIFLVWILLLAIFFAIFLDSLAKATSETVVKVEPQTSFAQIGETFDVNITVNNVQNLYGVELTFYWNASILELIAADAQLGVDEHPAGVLHNPISIYKNESSQKQGKLIIAGSSVSPAPSFNGSGIIAKITFKVTHVGSCELIIEAQLASNIIPPGSTSVAPIAYTPLDGFYYPIEITASPKNVNLYENISITGRVALAQPDIPVTVLYRKIGENEWHTLETVSTDEHGNYSCIWTPEKSGEYYVKSTAILSGSKETSNMISVEVNEIGEQSWWYVEITAAVVIVGVIVALLLIYKRRIRR